MLSEAQIRRVWEGLYEAKVRANYFAELSGKYQDRQKLATGMSLFFASGVVVTLLLRHPQLGSVIALLATAVSVYSVVAQNSTRAVESADLYTRWDKAAADYQAIWENVWAEDAAARLQAADDKARETSRSSIPLPANKKALMRWCEHVERELAARVSEVAAA